MAEALDEVIASDATGALPEQFERLDELLVGLVASGTDVTQARAAIG